MNRAVAVAVAVAMVAGAWVVRTQVIDGGGSGLELGGGDTAIVCSTDLPDVDVCDEQTPAGETLDSLEAGNDIPDIWIAAGPWGSIADEAVAGDPLFDDSLVVASTPLVAVVRRVPPQCGEAVTWRCLGDAAADSSVRISTIGSDRSVRLLVRAAFVTGYLDRSDYASNDFVDDPALANWLAEVERGLQRGRSFGATSLSDFLVKPGTADVFITTGAEAGALAASGVEVATPTPAVRVEAVAAIRDGRVPRGIADAFAEAGWQVPPESTGDDGLPSPGVLLALREV